uniref:Methionine--tRNA ligase n=1 Tax=Panagrolaimus sp. ES5 TaxID=591445 RepID=A0AC34G749_9BILA
MRPENQDTAFSWDDFMAKVNSELLNNLGNFIHRSMTFLYNSFDATVQEIELTDSEKELLKALDEDIKEFAGLLEDVKLRDGLSKILEVSRKGNQYFQANKPWVLVKGNEEEKKRAGSIISLGTNIALLIGTMLYPYMPQVSKQIRDFCNIEHVIKLPKHPIQFLKAGHKINQPVALFTKLEAEKVAEWKQRFGSAATDQPTTTSTDKKENKKGGKKDKKEKKASDQASSTAMTEGNNTAAEKGVSKKDKKEKKAAARSGGKKDKKEKKASDQAPSTAMTEVNNTAAEKGVSKKDKKEKKAAARSEKQAKAEQPTKVVEEDPALKGQLDEIRTKFNMKQVKTVHSEAANEANATADKLEKEFFEMQKYFYETLVPAYQKNRLSEIEDE